MYKSSLYHFGGYDYTCDGYASCYHNNYIIPRKVIGGNFVGLVYSSLQDSL